METTAKMPVLDLNTIQPSAEVMKLEKDTFNLRSADIAKSFIELILDGVIDPLEFAVKKKLVTDALDLVMNDPQVKKLAVEEVEKYGKEGASRLGAKVTVISRASYEYAKDPRWLELTRQAEPYVARVKEQEEKIKAACKNNASLIDNESGEMIASIVPHPKTDSIAVSFNPKKK